MTRRSGRRRPRPALWFALAVAAMAIAGLAALAAPRPAAQAQPALKPAELVAAGRALFLEGCAACHGPDARGIEGRAPSLYGAGAASAHFYLSTGRMPLEEPNAEPLRGEVAYGPLQIAALVAFVAALGDGPPIPRVEPARGDVAEGRALFAEHCAGCHQIMGQGGAVTDAGLAPALTDATPTQVGEAIRVGPYVMPAWTEDGLSDAEVNDIARYVEEHVQSPPDPGGWGIGHTGPVPEGLVALLVVCLVLVGLTRVIGERSR